MPILRDVLDSIFQYRTSTPELDLWNLMLPEIPPFERTAAEIAAGVTPTNYAYTQGDVRRYGAVGDGSTNDTAAIQRAIDVGGCVIFPDGTYSAALLTTATDGQKFFGIGNAIIKKRANGALWTCNARDTFYLNITWSGESAAPAFTGDNFVVTQDNCSLLCCSSRFAFGRAVKSTTGNGLRILGTNGVYQTADATASGYDIELTGGGNYSRIVSITSSQTTGGVLIDNAGGVSISDSQIGKLTVQNVGGVFATNNRLHGLIVIKSSNCALANNAIANSVTLGNGATNYSNIMFADSNIMEGGTTFTVESGVIDSVIHVEGLQDAGVTVVLNVGADCYVTARGINYTPTWTASTANPALGNGSFPYATYTRKGRRVAVDVSIVMGSTTTFGTGTWRFSLPFTISAAKGAIGAAWALDATNVPYTMIALADVGLNYVTFNSDQSGGSVGAANPFVWAQDDRLRFSIEYEI